ncbi:general secretion pathway protein GspB [Noviherbaspirillum sp. UKPF54]|uniref:general secretion pathway protein GspB n=1 Tax=Noviherbaspirillum sp. UKPF54 TaxID=2601898 RepID=UPI00143E035B|nr:general secretion pathway protein GspB [Noviherbaspirillum sp. UKPF54]
MSYILDALKRAEAERGTGAPHGQHLPPAAAASAAPAPQRAPWPWIIAGTLASALAAALAALAWLRSAPQPAPQPAPAVPAVLAQSPPAPPAAATSERPEAAPAQAEPTRQPPAPREVLPATVAKMPTVKKAPAPPAANPPDAAPVLALRDLPDAIQRQIPPLKVGGYIYSTNKAERSVLINDRLLAEGNEAAPGLVLERMLPDGMIMRYQDYRFRIRY